MLKKLFSRREEEKKLRTTDRLPPGQSLTHKFPVLHYGTVPSFNPQTWNFKVFGEVEQEVSWTWAEFLQLPRTKITIDLHCVTRWSKADTNWEGVALKTLLDEGFINLKPNVKHVLQHCEQGYTTNTSLALLKSDIMLLATHYEGELIPPEHGYPLRMVIGSKADRSEEKTSYLWKGGKWLRALEFLTTDKLGFWEKNGYHNEADPWREERFSEQSSVYFK